ncbi:unnamed protein product [Withania somnifera]
MDGAGNSSSWSQRLDEGTSGAASIGLQKLEQCSFVHYMNDSQLFGVSAPVGGGAPAKGAVAENMIGGVDKRKRGRPPRNQAVKAPPPKRQREEDEDVCFICFDGGSLVLCDRRGCPKAYHPACIKRDEAFFRSKAKWNCGWHICSMCQRASHYLCYTCTYSLCKACTKSADYLCVRGNKGFCSTCMKTIMLIENKDQADKEMVQVDFDDKTSWEYLFKVYWVILKENLSLTLDELLQAKNPWKELDAVHGKRMLLPYGHYVANDGKSIAGKPFDNLEMKKPLELLELSKKYPPTTESQINAESNNLSIFSSTLQSEQTKPAEELELQNEDCLRTKQGSSVVQTSVNGCMEWASKELLDFVAYMKDGDTSAISQFDVQTLLLDYIKKNNLRDPRRKSQIICDLRLKNLFGKPCVGHIEMLKLLEFHFLIKDDSEKSAFIPAGIVGTVTSHVEPDDSYGISLSRKRKSRKNGEVKMTQINLDEYAAIDAHNINFLYLRRELMENLAEDVEKFHDRVIGSVVRIRIPCNDQKQETYRLVRVVGTCKSSEPYKIRDKTVDVLLEVLNLDKKEAISIDTISNQDFCEDECRRLRQSIKCGLVKRLTVAEIQKKAMELRTVKLNDSLEAEILRLNNLRDRASEKGHKKELRECIEKLELLNTPQERHRRLLEVPEVHADPKMNPDYESEGGGGEQRDKKKVEHPALRCTRISRRDEKPVSSGSRVKEEGSIMDRCRMSEKREACGTNILDKQGNQLTVEQAVDRSGSETSIASLSTANSSSINSSETEKLWHYRDPARRIQGPFSVMQLRKWNTSGLFPPDMRIWTNHEHEDSVLLTNVLKGIFHKESHVHDKTSSRSWEPAGSDSRTKCGKREAPGHFQNTNYCSNGNIEFTKMNGLSPSFPQCVESLRGNNSCTDKPQLSSSQSSSQREVILALPRQEKGHENDNFRSVTDHGIQNSRKSTLCHAQSNSQNLGPSSGQNQGSFTSNKCSINLDSGSSLASATKSSDSFEQQGKMNLPGLPSPTPETSYGDIEAQAAEKLLLLSSVIPACSSDIHDLPSPTPFQMVKFKPIEFSTLAEESVSDLLAEVDAMESQNQNGMGSPTSAMRCGEEMIPGCKTDCFSPIEELSHTHDPVRSDALSSTGDLQLPCQSTVTDETVGASRADAFDQLRRSGGNSSTSSEGETKSADVLFSQGDVGSGIPVPCTTTSQTNAFSAIGRNTAFEGMPDGGGAAPGNPVWGGPVQGYANVGFGSSTGAAWGNSHMNRGAPFTGNPVWDSQRRYAGERSGGPRDWALQGGESGFGRGRPPWNRQQPYGGGGYSRPPKGQRICKFYESGRCKKGAACDYLHP